MDQRERPIASRSVYEGAILNLRVDDVVMPNGRETKREVVEHSPAVGIVAVQDGCLFLVEQFRYAVRTSLLEIPAGIVEKGESPVETACREIQEEIGYRADRMEEIGRLYTSPGFSEEELIFFWADGLSPSKLPADDDESIVVRKVPIPEVWNMIRDGTIRDGKTVAILSRLALEGKIAYH